MAHALKLLTVLVALAAQMAAAGIGGSGGAIAAQISQPGTSQSGAGGTDIEDALEMIRDGNVESGVDMLRRIGELGDSDAFFHLAEIHRLGAGKEASEGLAMMYYRLAAQMGNKQGALNLANLLFFGGDGGRAAVEEALAIWQQYALGGDVEAMYLLGMVYWNGEGGLVPDPIRGYGLIWRASEAGYDPAASVQPEMRTQLKPEAIAAGEQYGESFEANGFSKKPLDLHLVTDTPPDLPDNPDKATKPDDWGLVWRLEVGFAMSNKDTVSLQEEIASKQKEAVGDLYNEIVESPTRPGLYKLLFGPLKGMQDAVNRCVKLKRAGFDCFAKPPR